MTEKWQEKAQELFREEQRALEALLQASVRHGFSVDHVETVEHPGIDEGVTKETTVVGPLGRKLGRVVTSRSDLVLKVSTEVLDAELRDAMASAASGS